MSILYVAFGGFLGSMLRFYISEKTYKHLIGTWIANITGSFLLAYLLNLHINEMLSDAFWLLLGVGFCGAYTTFSTFSNEVLQLVMERKYMVALTYIFGTLFISILLVGTVIFINSP